MLIKRALTRPKRWKLWAMIVLVLMSLVLAIIWNRHVSVPVLSQGRVAASPDGQYLAIYGRRKGTREAGVWLYEIHRHQWRKLVDGEFAHVNWMPDSRTLLAMQSRLAVQDPASAMTTMIDMSLYDHTLYRLTLDGHSTQLTSLRAFRFPPVLTPDGSGFVMYRTARSGTGHTQQDILYYAFETKCWRTILSLKSREDQMFGALAEFAPCPEGWMMFIFHPPGYGSGGPKTSWYAFDRQGNLRRRATIAKPRETIVNISPDGRSAIARRESHTGYLIGGLKPWPAPDGTILEHSVRFAGDVPCWSSDGSRLCYSTVSAVRGRKRPSRTIGHLRDFLNRTVHIRIPEYASDTRGEYHILSVKGTTVARGHGSILCWAGPSTLITYEYETDHRLSAERLRYYLQPTSSSARREIFRSERFL